MPLLLLALFIADLLSVGFLVLGIWLFREWYEYRYITADDYPERCLYGAIALFAFMLLGKFLSKPFLSRRRPSEDEPQMFATSSRDELKRPDGSVINIEYYGNQDGQPIIFVHGWNLNTNIWYYQKKFFEKDHRIILIDLPGLGKSKRPSNRDFSLEKMSEDLHAVIVHTGASNAILWGHSIGGMTILTLLAHTHPELKKTLKGIILQHTTYTNPTKTSLLSSLMRAIEKPVIVPLCYLMIALSPIFWIKRWMSYLNGNSHITTRLMTFAGTQTSKQLEHATFLSTLAPPAVTARGMLGMLKYDVSKELAYMNLPALIIAADKDRLTKPEASQHMKAMMPDSELVMLSPSNHQGLLERHTEVNLAAARFISARKFKVQS